MDNFRGNRKDRTLIIHSCNDVTSPPLWELPLVHSPYYLGQLYEFAEEARRDDLFVPLEFDMSGKANTMTATMSLAMNFLIVKCKEED